MEIILILLLQGKVKRKTKVSMCLDCTDLSDSRKGQTSGTGGVEGCSFASAMMCSKVMSVWVHTSTTWISWGGPWGRPLGVRLMTCTTTGALAARKASTVSSWLDLDNSFPFTWRKYHPRFHYSNKTLLVWHKRHKWGWIQTLSRVIEISSITSQMQSA